MLHITNGDSAVSRLGAGGMEGELLPWRDVLHDGPVPGNLPLDELSRVRARFIADCGWGEFEDVVADFEARDRKLAAFADHEEVVLWFEHDLYDQLQLLQVLDWFAGRERGRTRLSIVTTDEYLGTLSVRGARQHFERRRDVSVGQMGLARDAWRAFRSIDPRNVEELLRRDTADLPHLDKALRRHLEQFPWFDTGLSRSEAQAIVALREGASTVREAFPAAHLQVEDPIWLGDGVFVWYLEGLASGRAPLVRLGAEPANDPLAREVRLTDVGLEVFDGRADRVKLNGIDRWLGGVRLSGDESPWRWNQRAGRVQRPV